MANSKFKVAFRSDESTRGEKAILWEEGCPLLVKAIQVSRDTVTGDAYLQLRLTNITYKQIGSFAMRVTCAYEDGSTEEVEVNPLDADIAPCSDFVPKPIALSRGDVVSASAVMNKVDVDGTPWTSSGNPAPLPSPEVLELTEEELAERKKLLGKAGVKRDYLDVDTGHKCSLHDKWTLCSCGQVSVGIERCLRCAMPFSEAQNLQDPEYLDNKVEESKRLKAEADERAAKSAKRNRTIAIIVLAVIILAIVGVVVNNNVIQPMMKYDEAQSMLENGDFDGARAAFEELGDYKDSPAKIGEVELSRGDSFFNNGDLYAALDKYSELGMNDKVQQVYAAMYDAAAANNSSSNEVAYDYLKTLISAKYPGASKVYDKVFKWKFSVKLGVAKNVYPKSKIKFKKVKRAKWPYSNNTSGYYVAEIKVKNSNPFEPGTLVVKSKTRYKGLYRTENNSNKNEIMFKRAGKSISASGSYPCELLVKRNGKYYMQLYYKWNSNKLKSLKVFEGKKKLASIS